MTIIRRIAGTVGAAAGLALALSGCEYSKHIQATPEEWRTVSPGQPLAKFPTTHVIEQGKGPAVELGHLVKIRLRMHVTIPSDTFVDMATGGSGPVFVLTRIRRFTPRRNASPAR